MTKLRTATEGIRADIERQYNRDDEELRRHSGEDWPYEPRAANNEMSFYLRAGDVRGFLAEASGSTTKTNEDIERAVTELLEFKLESTPQLADPPCMDCGWEEDQHRKDGGAGTDHKFNPGPDPEAPFFSEAYLYDLVGKEDARTILALFGNLLAAVGVPPEDIP